jgi:MFS family permease
VSAEANKLGRNFGYVWSAAGCSNLGDGIVKIALPLLAVQLTDSPAGVAGVAVASYLPWILLALPAGALADRVDRRNAMRSVNVVRATVVGVLAVVATNDLGGLTVVYVAAFVLGAGETLFDTSAQSLLPAIVDRTTLTKANSRLFALEQTTNEFIGPPLGGWLTGLGIAFHSRPRARCSSSRRHCFRS